MAESVLSSSRRARLAAVARACAFACALVVSACTTLPSNEGRSPSTAFDDADGTPLGRIAAVSLASALASALASSVASAGGGGASAEPRTSAFQLVSAGDEAYGTLYTLITHAARSLDLQYYIVADDPYAHALLRAARQAAEHGVRVRLLIDDFYTTGKDRRIAWYAAHPNIEVRVFNPFVGGRSWFATRVVASLTDLGRINRRMHNKLFVVDNALALTGGRNVGAEYYQHSERANFLDLDVLAAGPIVKELSASFDRYWNSAFAFPIERLAGVSEATADTIDQRALSDPNDPVIAATAEAVRSGQRFDAVLASGRLAMSAAPAELVADRPTKVGRSRPRLGPDGLVAGATIATDLLAIIGEAENELIVVSPYFVPGERGMQAFRALLERGVKVRILTNSLAATDAAIVHIGYAKYRRALVALGAEVYELRPDPGQEGERLGVLGSSKASLHAKVQIIDRKTLFVGSFNVDPRSSLANTEMGISIDSEALAVQMAGILRDRGEESRYRVTIADDGGLQWTTRTNGVEQVYRDEPGAGALLRITLKLLAPFAPEELL